MISQAYNTAVAVSNNMKWIHWNVTAGPDFDAVHDLAGSYYDKLQDDIDTLAELAIELGESITNPALVKSAVPVETSDCYDYEQSIVAILNNLAILLSTLHSILDSTEHSCDYISEIRKMSRYWSKELNYKGQRRLHACAPAQDSFELSSTRGLELIEPQCDSILEIP